MESRIQKDRVTRLELICVRSAVKFLRAGYANILLVIGAVFASILWDFLLELRIGTLIAAIGAGGVFVVFGMYYSTFVARIVEDASAIRALKAFSDVQIPIAAVTGVRISVIGPSQFAKVTIEQEAGKRTHRLRLICPASNIGTFNSMVEALEGFARRYNNYVSFPRR